MIELLWRITVGSWITAGAIISLRLLFRKHLSAKSKYLLWLLLLVRLMLPVLPESPLSVMNLANTSAPVTAATPISRQSAQNPAAEHEIVDHCGTNQSASYIQTNCIYPMDCRRAGLRQRLWNHDHTNSPTASFHGANPVCWGAKSL